MPHFYLEYSDNIKNETNISDLLQKLNDVFLSHHHIIPAGGLKMRAMEFSEYVIADGKADDAFVHATLKLAKGRTEEDKKALCEDLFETMETHFDELLQKRYIGLSMEFYEFATPTYKKSNIHTRFK
ncbi:5-carboxymethyl-2-hydroxymuconate Delta-isomerase [Lentibacillus halophilus]|uniref:5-carboxymethyl-2-hydroxymuconate Delta-isomerase n=1 Tax=Lentibacillus halophilus TaxID=295065 RepID=A0ABP3J3Y8_9BACI